MKLHIKFFNEAIVSQICTKMNFYNITDHNRLYIKSKLIGKISNYDNEKRSLSDIKNRSKYYNIYVKALIHSEGIKRISGVSNNGKN